MKFRKKFFGGTRPIYTGSPAIGVVGGFTLDKSKINIPVGAIIPAGSLAQYDEATRKSVVLKIKNGQYFVSPDNGTLTLVAQTLGIDSVREIDEKANRLKGS